MTLDIRDLPLELVDLMILNEIEGTELTSKTNSTAIVSSLLEKYPETRIVLTLGAQGAVYIDQAKRLEQQGFKVNPVDTTAAGDTFVGYFVASLCSGLSEQSALHNACRAASICVMSKGAADSIPCLDEVLKAND